MNFEEMKAEAQRRGIEPGVVCRSRYGTVWTVDPMDKWRLDDLDGLTDSVGAMIWSSIFSEWATVITPAPSQPTEAPQPTEGLVYGLACEPDEHMRKAIVVKALDLGYADNDNYGLPTLVWEPRDYPPTLRQKSGISGGKFLITPGEFYDRLCAMKPKEKTIMIGNKKVQFLDGGNIEVGCTAVDFETLEAAYNRAKATKETSK